MPLRIHVQRGGRKLGVTLAPHLDEWTEANPLVAALHSGDVGWHLRNTDEALESAFTVWSADQTTVAIGMADGRVLRTAFAPDWLHSAALAAAIARELEGIEYVEAPCGAVLRSRLLLGGWSADPDPLVLLYKELTSTDAEHEDTEMYAVSGTDDVEARVAVQRSAFAPGSTFQPELWERMTAGPSYDARFELLARTPTGEPAAAATGWFAGPGRCAILEPVGTHRDHQRTAMGVASRWP